jgi:hypothetical protein
MNIQSVARLAALMALVSMSPAAMAQNYTTIPPGLLTQEAYPWSYLFGEYREMRYQILSRDHVNKPMRIREIACRRDGARDTGIEFLGRTWANVQVTMGEHRTVTGNGFSWNLASNVTQVFSSRVSWPDHSKGPRTSIPHTWASDVVFPFVTPWSYTGKSGMTIDFIFRGGVLSGQRNWPGRTLYPLDGASDTKETISRGGGVGDFTKCIIAGFSSAPWVYARTVTTSAGKIGAGYGLSFYPAKTPTMIALSVTGNPKGFDVGNYCQKFYLGNGPILLSSIVTPRYNRRSFRRGMAGIAYDQRFVGLKVWAQAAFLLGSKSMALSTSGYAMIEPRPVFGFRASFTWSPSATSPQGSLPLVPHVPVLRLMY